MTATLDRPPTTSRDSGGSGEVPLSPIAPSHPAKPVSGVEPYRLSVEQYHTMINANVFGPEDRVELIEGFLVRNRDVNTPHAGGQELVACELRRLTPSGWHVRSEKPLTLEHSEPLPDLVIVRGQPRDYLASHPRPGDVALVVEMADSSLEFDRGWKRQIYAAARVGVYWVVNLIDRVVEVYSVPQGDGDQANYTVSRTYGSTDAVPLTVGEHEVALVPVAGLLP